MKVATLICLVWGLCVLLIRYVGLICVFIRWWLWVMFLTVLWSQWWREMMRIIPRSWETRLPSWRTRWRDSTTCASWAGAAEVPHLPICLFVYLSVCLWSDACMWLKFNNMVIKKRGGDRKKLIWSIAVYLFSFRQRQDTTLTPEMSSI